MTSATADPLNSRIGTQEDGYLDYESGIDKITTLPFEFQKTERAASHRKAMAPFSKQAPSKWDDAQKWIASPTSNRVKTEPSMKKNSHGNRQPVTKVVMEVADLRLVPYEEPDTKQIDEGDYVSSTRVDSYSKSVLMIGDSVGDAASKTFFLLFFTVLYSNSLLLIEKLSFMALFSNLSHQKLLDRRVSSGSIYLKTGQF